MERTEGKVVLTASEAAMYARINEASFRRMLKRGEWSGIATKIGGEWRLNRAKFFARLGVS